MFFFSLQHMLKLVWISPTSCSTLTWPCVWGPLGIVKHIPNSQRQRFSYHRDYFRKWLKSWAGLLSIHQKSQSFRILAFSPCTCQRKIAWCVGKRKCIPLFLSSSLSRTLFPRDPQTSHLSRGNHFLKMSWLRKKAGLNYGWILWPPLALCRSRSGR